jgi:phosphotransferase system enzyme I (PtsP)
VTSHVSILARSLGIPMVIVDMAEMLDIPARTKLLLDANTGDIHINPGTDVIKRYGIGRRHSRHIDLSKTTVTPETYTKDGVRITLLANINLFGDLKQALALNMEGVGLYRTEFPFLIRNDLPTEEEQYVIYRRVIRALKGKEIAIRTLDIGGDKVLAYYQDYHEANPFLGMRSIRFSLKNRDIFRMQIRAILRASADARLKIMFPMISSLDEFLESRQILNDCRDELVREGVELAHIPAVGILVEVPSVVEIIDELSREADFFSLGTNDFVQYMIGVDRTNEKVADYYLPHHPSVLRSLKRVVSGALSQGKEVSVCGEMAHQIRYIPFLLGIGIRVLSMNSVYLPSVQRTVSSVSIEDAQAKAAELLSASSIWEVEKLLGPAS